ncbi:sarcosine oxidase subunit delta [Hymenobacter daecheongensis]|uniref:sarcosine oxidase subunit delta n=1 Tax=Hymenobacter daecheongensis TaxID=496053 RepID=UPI001160F84F|nr:sarcosine oxidase subunit delta [Hymenobacter daecheongensis]
MAALLRFHYKVDPDTLSDRAYYTLWHDYLYVRSQERALLLGVMRQVISEAFPPSS